MRCAACQSALEASADRARCPACSATYPFDARYLELTPPGAEAPRAPRTLSTRLMQSPAVARVYESIWRPLTCALVTPASFTRQVALIRQAFGGPIRGPLLDLGTGTGNFARALARGAPALPVLAVDRSAPMLAVAAAQLERAALGSVLLLRADATRLPIRDGTFESALCCGTLHLLEEPSALLREVRRALRPGGRFVCLTYVRDGGPLRRRALARSRDLFGMELFEPARLEALVREAGLALTGVERAGLLAVLACAAP